MLGDLFEGSRGHFRVEEGDLDEASLGGERFLYGDKLDLKASNGRALIINGRPVDQNLLKGSVVLPDGLEEVMLILENELGGAECYPLTRAIGIEGVREAIRIHHKRVEESGAEIGLPAVFDREGKPMHTFSRFWGDD